jgi:hypothetical protein
MAIEVKIPAVGESITSGVVSVWHKKSGEFVNEGESLFTLETDKVSTEIVAEKGGLLETKVPEGQEVKIGEVVATIDDSRQPGAKKVPEPKKVEKPQEKKKEESEGKKKEAQPEKKQAVAAGDLSAVALAEADDRGAGLSLAPPDFLDCSSLFFFSCFARSSALVSLANAMFFPSGAQTGLPAPLGKSLKTKESPPAIGSIASWGGSGLPSFSVERRNNRNFPSGDQRGVVS